MTTKCGCGLTNNRLCANHIRFGWVDKSPTNTSNIKSKNIKNKLISFFKCLKFN